MLFVMLQRMVYNLALMDGEVKGVQRLEGPLPEDVMIDASINRSLVPVSRSCTWMTRFRACTL